MYHQPLDQLLNNMKFKIDKFHGDVTKKDGWVMILRF